MVQTPSAVSELKTVKWSVDDYHRMIRAGILQDRRVELLAGDIVEMVPVEPEHEDTGDMLAEYLRRMLGQQAKVRECKAITLSASEPQPDIAVVETRRYREHHPYPEQIYLLIEIAKSRPVRDVETKRKVYAAAGIQDYWVLNLQTQQLRVFRDIVDGDYQSDQVWMSKTISPLCFPEVELSVRQIVEG